MSNKSTDPKAFPLGNVLKDLALLRVSDIQTSSLLPNEPIEAPEGDLKRSYTFTKEARAAIRSKDRDAVEDQAVRLEFVRSGLDELLKGLEKA